MAGLLLFAFRGITDALIPLFAIGAFLTFTLSQAGMVSHWRRVAREPAGKQARALRAHFLINTSGAITTAIALVVIVVAKFKEGAWITIVVIPLVIMLLRTIHTYYANLERRTRETEPLRLQDTRPPIVLVVMESWNKLAYKALNMALSLSPDVIAVHLLHLSGPEEQDHRQGLDAQWRISVEQPVRAAGLAPPRLMILPAPHRALHEPILKLARKLESESGGRRIAVLIPEMIKLRWYQYLLHVDRGRQLRSRLMKCGDPGIMVIDVPWYWDDRGRRPSPSIAAAQRTNAS